MKKIEVTVIDYGTGNLLSVMRSFEFLGAKVLITDDSKKILSSQNVILPGVGAFKDGMEALEHRDLITVLQDFKVSKNKLLGICLGMQLLFDESSEFGYSKGLSFIPGEIVQIPSNSHEDIKRKIPHIGWNTLLSENNSFSKFFEKKLQTSTVYFNHSFMAIPNSEEFILSTTNYQGCEIASIVKKDNVLGFQFHPEKSGTTGLAFLKNWLFS